MSNEHKIQEFIKKTDGFSAKQIISFAHKTFKDRVQFATSLGEEDQVITDIIASVAPEIGIFTLDTGRLFPETYALIDKTKKKYPMTFKLFSPDTSAVEKMVEEKGINLFYDSIENRKLCCEIRKVHPLEKILSTLDGWISGIRRDQTTNRLDAKMLEIDNQHSGIIKINPLIDWSWKQTKDYISENNIPYNKLLDQGYTSIGCEPCTRSIKEGEDLRAGRWWWEDDTNKECGLHMDHQK